MLIHLDVFVHFIVNKMIYNTKTSSTSPSRGGLLASINKSSLSAPATTSPSRKLKHLMEMNYHLLYLFQQILKINRREYDKQMRLIEVCLIMYEIN